MTPGRLKIWNLNADVWQYTPGGSQPFANLLSIDHTDIPNNGNTKTLLALPAGSVVIGISWDPATAVNWSNGDALQIGNPPTGSLLNGDFDGWVEMDPTTVAAAVMQKNDAPDSASMVMGTARYIAGSVAPAGMIYSPGATSVVARFLRASGSAPTTGHLDIFVVYLMVA